MEQKAFLTNEKNELILCNHIIENSPFCIKCNSIYHPPTNISSIKKLPVPLNSEIKINDIYTHMKEKKYINSTNNPHLSPIESRSWLLDKIRKTIAKLGFHKSTYYLCIYLMDILSLQDTKAKLIVTNEQIALGTLFLSVKYNEKDTFIPNLLEMQNLFMPKIYLTIDQLRKIEVYCLKNLEYSIRYFTPYDFLDFYTKVGIFFGKEIVSAQIIKDCFDVLDYIIRKNNEYLFFESDLLALSIIFVVKKYNQDMLEKMISYAYEVNKEQLDFIIDYVASCYHIIIEDNNFLKKISKTKNKSPSLSLNKKGSSKKINRSSSASTSSGEVSLNLQKIKEQSKLIKRNIYSLNVNLLDHEKEKEKSNMFYNSGFYKFRLNQLKLSLNNSITKNNTNTKRKDGKEFMFYKEKSNKERFYPERDSSKIKNTSRLKNHVNRNIKINFLQSSKSVMLSFDKGFIPKNDTHRKLLSSSMMNSKQNIGLTTRNKVSFIKGVLGPNKF